MRIFVAVIGLITLFVIPLAGLVILLVAVTMSPPGRRADGRRRTGGLLGGLWDRVASPESTCPACRTQIPYEASVCAQCRTRLNWR